MAVDILRKLMIIFNRNEAKENLRLFSLLKYFSMVSQQFYFNDYVIRFFDASTCLKEKKKFNFLMDLKLNFSLVMRKVARNFRPSRIFDGKFRAKSSPVWWRKKK